MLALYISLLDTEEQISKFEHIYTKYRGLMFYTAKGVLQDSYLAEDAVHETFLDIIRIIDSIRANNEKELSQFLRVLTHHKAVDMVRKCTRQKKSDTEIEDCNGVQREHNKKLNNGLPILHKVPPKRDYGRYFCIMAEKGGTSHGGLTEKLSPFFHAKKQEVNAYGR